MDNITNEQKAFLDVDGHVVLCACPGSGKTYIVARKLLNYIQNWKYIHQGVAALSFTNVASEEIEKQTKDLVADGYKIEYPHYIGTLDSFINNYILLRFGYLLMPNPQRPTIAIKDLFTVPFRFWKNECHRKGCVEGISDFRWDMDGNLLRNKQPVECKGNSYGPPCYQYKRMLLNNGFVFQSEVAGFSYWLLRDYPQIAKALAARFPIIILDEAQDTSIEQMAVLDLICDNINSSYYNDYRWLCDYAHGVTAINKIYRFTFVESYMSLLTTFVLYIQRSVEELIDDVVDQSYWNQKQMFWDAMKAWEHSNNINF